MSSDFLKKYLASQPKQKHKHIEVQYEKFRNLFPPGDKSIEQRSSFRAYLQNPKVYAAKIGDAAPPSPASVTFEQPKAEKQPES